MRTSRVLVCSLLALSVPLSATSAQVQREAPPGSSLFTPPYPRDARPSIGPGLPKPKPAARGPTLTLSVGNVQALSTFAPQGTATAAAGLASLKYFIDGAQRIVRPLSGTSIDIGKLALTTTVTEGAHTIGVEVADRNGRTARRDVQFQAGASGNTGGGNTGGGAGQNAVLAVQLQTPVGARSGVAFPMAGTITAPNGLASVEVFLDTRKLTTLRQNGRKTLALAATGFQPVAVGLGIHTLRVDAVDTRGARAGSTVSFNISR